MPAAARAASSAKSKEAFNVVFQKTGGPDTVAAE
jgi:hypothetical protein